MKLITRDTDYAIRALIYIAGSKDKMVSVSELAKKLKIPRPFLRKILQILTKESILRSQKGKAGGFSLAKPASNILIVNLMKIFQGDLKIVDCLLRGRVCPTTKGCSLRKRLVEIEKHLVKQLKEINVGLLLRESNFKQTV